MDVMRCAARNAPRAAAHRSGDHCQHDRLARADTDEPQHTCGSDLRGSKEFELDSGATVLGLGRVTHTRYVEQQRARGGSYLETRMLFGELVLPAELVSFVPCCSRDLCSDQQLR